VRSILHAMYYFVRWIVFEKFVKHRSGLAVRGYNSQACKNMIYLTSLNAEFSPYCSSRFRRWNVWTDRHDLPTMDPSLSTVVRSVGIVRSRTKAMEFSILVLVSLSTVCNERIERSVRGRPDSAEQPASRLLCVSKTRLPIGIWKFMNCDLRAILSRVAWKWVVRCANHPHAARHRPRKS
jgi:hypothetical protein